MTQMTGRGELQDIFRHHVGQRLDPIQYVHVAEPVTVLVVIGIMYQVDQRPWRQSYAAGVRRPIEDFR